MSLTWRDLIGPVSVFINGHWQNGKVVEIRTNAVMYKLSGDRDSFIISKDGAHSIIRKRITVASVGKDKTYTGSNPFVFGPKGCNIYRKRIVERKDRPGTFRAYSCELSNAKALQSSKHQNKPWDSCTFSCFICCVCVFFFFHILLPHLMQESGSAASFVCDAKIRECLSYYGMKFSSQ